MQRSGVLAGAVVAVPVAFLLLIVVLVAALGGGPMAGPAVGAALNPGTVPGVFSGWIAKAATVCPQINGPLIAAQLQAESNFNPNAVSPAGAAGAAQFMPGTWPTWGRDDDANGRVSPFDVGDAVMAQARYMCALAAQMAAALAKGKLHGSLTDLAIAAYNAGPGAVLAAGGVPQNGESPDYVQRIEAAMPGFSAGTPAGTPGGGLVVNDGSFGSSVVLSAQRWLGLPYVWGGGNATGPTGGGFDCSGLALNAVAAASGGRIVLPHNAAAQSQMGAPVSGPQLRPGDLLFFANTPGQPAHHVGIFLGGSQMLDAPDFGQTVQLTALNTPYYRAQVITARRFG